MEHGFSKEKVAIFHKISEEVLNDVVKEIGYVGDDTAADKYMIRLSATVYAMTAAEIDVVYSFGIPTFMDWLLGRRRTVTINVKARDLLKHAPLQGDCIRTYAVDIK